jgi:hypothetical protein
MRYIWRNVGILTYIPPNIKTLHEKHDDWTLKRARGFTKST